MTLEEAYDRLPEYLSGELDSNSRAALEKLLGEDRGLAEAYRLSLVIEDILRKQEWLEPSAQFTWKVLCRAGLVRQKSAPLWVRAWEPVKWGMSAGAFVALVMMIGHVALSRGVLVLEQVGRWFDRLTGVEFFALNPLVLIWFFLPLIVGGVATCVLSGRCRLDL